MARKKKDSSGELIGIIFIITIIAYIFLTPLILIFGWIRNRYLLSKIIKNVEGSVSDFWLTMSERDEFESICRTVDNLIKQKNKAINRGLTENISKNKDGSFSARSKIGKEISFIISNCEKEISPLALRYNILSEYPINRWLEFDEVYTKSSAYYYSILSWFTFIILHITIFWNGYTSNLSKLSFELLSLAVYKSRLISIFNAYSKIIKNNSSIIENEWIMMIIAPTISIFVYFIAKKIINTNQITPMPPKVTVENFNKFKLKKMLDFLKENIKSDNKSIVNEDILEPVIDEKIEKTTINQDITKPPIISSFTKIFVLAFLLLMVLLIFGPMLR
jgi:hypothetical protein